MPGLGQLGAPVSPAEDCVGSTARAGTRQLQEAVPAPEASAPAWAAPWTAPHPGDTGCKEQSARSRVSFLGPCARWT